MATRKTTSDVINDVIALIIASQLKSVVNGSIYKSQDRPIGSKAEDIVVNCIASSFEQVQEFSVNVNIFVPRIEGAGNNVYLQDTGRITVISTALNEFVEGIVSDEYKIECANAVNYDEVPQINQDYVNITLRLYRLSQTLS